MNGPCKSLRLVRNAAWMRAYRQAHGYHKPHPFACRMRCKACRDGFHAQMSDNRATVKFSPIA